jgi:hypothetical protein
MASKTSRAESVNSQYLFEKLQNSIQTESAKTKKRQKLSHVDKYFQKVQGLPRSW